MTKNKIEKKSLGLVNVEISISDEEVRAWFCDPTKGISVYRIKARGKVHRGHNGVVILPPTEVKTTA